MGGFLSGILGENAAKMQEGEGGGFLEGFGNILQNPLVAQYLSGVGQGLATGGFQGGVNAGAGITQQNIQNKNLMNLFSKMLAGQNPGTTAKLDDKGLSINIARETPIGSPGPNPGQTGIPQMMDNPLAPPDSETVRPTQPGGTLNPFESGLPNLSASELAGLTPELITQALGFRMQQASQLADNAYKQKLMQQIDSQMLENDRQYEVSQAKNDTELLKLMTKDERTDIEKQYDRAKTEGYKGNLIDFKKLGSTPGAIEEYEKAKSEGYKGKFIDYIKFKGQAGSTTINVSPFDRAMQTGEAEARLSVTSPDFVAKVTKELENDPEYRNPSGARTDDPTEIGNLRKRRLINTMHDKIVRAYSGAGERVTPVKGGWKVTSGKNEFFIRGPQ